MKYKNIQLKDVADIVMGQSPKSVFYNTNGNGIPFLQGVRTFGENYPQIDTWTTSYNRKAKSGEILFSVRAPVGRVNWANQDLAVGRGLAALKIKSGYSKEYLYYLFKKIGGQLDSLATGTVFTSINKKELEALELKIPVNLSDQEKIADYLQKFDQEIELNNQINDNLISLATTLFNKYFPNINSGNEMIGNFISNYDRLRKPLSKKERLSIPGKYRYIGATSVNDYINKYNFDGIYLLLGEDGTVEDDNGYPILQYISGKFWPNNHAHVLQGKNVSTEWLYLFFKQRKITSIVTGAVQKKISQKNLNSLSISIPDKDKLARFDTIINPIFKNIRIIESENHSLEKIKLELLSKLF